MSVSEVPLYELVPVFGPGGKPLDAYRGVRDMSSGSVVSVVSDRYGLVGHRAIAEAVHQVGAALGRPDPEAFGARAAAFTPERITLYQGGRRMEVKLVVGQKFSLGEGENFFPGLRILNSLDGAWAVRVEAFAVRACCTNQLYAGARSFMEFRELHLSSPEDLLGQLERGIHEALNHFSGAIDVFGESMRERMDLVDVVPALETAGIPRRHAKAIGEKLPEYFGSTLWGQTSRWEAYNLATDVLTHDVHVAPDRDRAFERGAGRGGPPPRRLPLVDCVHHVRDKGTSEVCNCLHFDQLS
jgi:hypothetical protein